MDKKILCEELIENSQEKIKILKMVKELTQKQNTYLQDKNVDAFLIIAESKKELLDKMDKNDSVFEEKYSKFSSIIKEDLELEHVPIEKLKETIDTIQNLIIDTQEEEKKNYKLYSSVVDDIKKQVKNSKKKISEYNKYKK